MKRFAGSVVVALLAAAPAYACGSSDDAPGPSPTADAGDVDTGSSTEGGASSDAGTDAPDGASKDALADVTDAADAADARDAFVPAPFCKTGDATCLARLDIAGLALPYYRSHDFATSNAAIQNLVLVMHGNGRDPDSFFSVVAGLAYARDPVHTLVVAPWMQCTDDAPVATDLSWSCGGWIDGNRALGTPRPLTTSYGAIDSLVVAAKAAFPSITRVTIVGYSAGAQVVNRYLAGSTEADRTPAITTRFVVGSPSSYLYFDDRRLVQAAVCPDMAGCTVDATSFASPFYDAAACPAYDQYKYGLEAGSPTGYLANLIAGGTTVADLTARYVSRKVVYVLSTNDDKDVGGVDTSCEANAQGPSAGSFRLQRGLTYHRYVDLLLGATHRVVVVPVCAHDHKCVLSTTATQDEMFGP